MGFVARVSGLLAACAVVAVLGSGTGDQAVGAPAAADGEDVASAACKLGGIRYAGRYTRLSWAPKVGERHKVKKPARNPRMCFTVSANRRKLREWVVKPCSAPGAPRLVVPESRVAYPPGLPLSAQGYSSIGQGTVPVLVDGAQKFLHVTFTTLQIQGGRASGKLEFRSARGTNRLVLGCEWSARQTTG